MPANVSIADDPLVQQSAESLAAMEAEAAEFFAARGAEQNRADAALNPVAPALEKAAAAPTKAKAAPAAPAAPAKAPEKPSATSAGKVPGAPTFPKKAEPKPETDATTNGDATKDQFADIPREYKAGNIRAANWDKLHSKADHYEALSTQRAQEITDLKAALESAKQATGNGTPNEEVQQRLTSLQQERDSLLTQLKAVAGERVFDAESKPRRDAEILAAKDAVGPQLAKEVEELLTMPRSPFRDQKIAEIAESLPILQRDELLASARALNRLDAERSRAAAQGGEIWQRKQNEWVEQQERQNAERIAKASSTFDAELKEWEPVGLSKEDLDNARSVYSGKGSTLQDAARAALWAVAGPKAAAMAQELQAKVGELEIELTKLRGAQPGVGAAASGALPSDGADDDDPAMTSYSDRIAKQALRSGVRFGT